MRDMKYIIAKNDFGSPVCVIFPNTVIHATFSRTFRNIISAGFCSIDMDIREQKIVGDTWGYSESLGLDSRPEDKDILNRFLEKGI